jgi:predicted metal-binding protein
MIEKIKKAAELYEYAILIMLKVPPEKMLSGADEKGKVADRRKIAEIISTVEGAAFYDGHYLAMGFGAGSCKMTWCPKVPCQVLESGTCRVPLKSRPSMESVGFDVFRMAANVGWDIRPVGTHCKIEKIPHALRIGLILVE